MKSGHLMSMETGIKVLVVFVTMFLSSCYLARIEWVDYPDYIFQKRCTARLLSSLALSRGRLCTTDDLVAIGVKGCREEWMYLDGNLPDNAGLLALMGGLLFWGTMIRRVWVSRNWQLQIDYRWFGERGFVQYIPFIGGLAVFTLVNVTTTAGLRKMTSFLVWPNLSATDIGNATSLWQLGMAWDQLLACDMWLMIIHCALSLVTILMILVWTLTRIHCAGSTRCSLTPESA